MQLSFNEKNWISSSMFSAWLGEYAPLFTFKAVVKRTVCYNLKSRHEHILQAKSLKLYVGSSNII